MNPGVHIHPYYPSTTGRLAYDPSLTGRHEIIITMIYLTFVNRMNRYNSYFQMYEVFLVHF